MRVAALVGEQTRWHDAGWWRGAGRTVGDRATPARGARGVRPLFFLLLPDCARRIPHEKNGNRSRGAMLRKSVQWTRGLVHATLC